jgi:hypothetical protein
MNRIKYNFLTRKEYKPEVVATKPTYFYQICTFPDKHTNKYHLRKFTVNEQNEFTGISDYQLSTNQCKKFFNTKKDHEYKSYPMYSLEYVGYPNMSDVLGSKSDILNHRYSYTGSAPFY